MTTVEEDDFGHYFDPLQQKVVPVTRFTMNNGNNLTISVITLGASINSVEMPDMCGNIDNICMGFDNIEEYRKLQEFYFGSTIGRVANRIASGQYKMQDKIHQITRNYNDKYHWNGGHVGFDQVNWEVLKVTRNGVIMQHVSPHGHEGYQGDLTTTVDFSLEDNGSFRIFFEAFTNKMTIVNVSNNTYFNLAGHGAGKDALYNHSVWINATKMVAIDKMRIPTGEIVSIRGSPFDFSKMTNLGKRLLQFRDCPLFGFDHCYCVNPMKNRTALVGKISDPLRGRWMEIYSNQPGLYFNTANEFPDGDRAETPILGRNNTHYVRHGAFCVSSGKFPDAPNHHRFKGIFLSPEGKYAHEFIYRFGVSRR